MMAYDQDIAALQAAMGLEDRPKSEYPKTLARISVDWLPPKGSDADKVLDAIAQLTPWITDTKVEQTDGFTAFVTYTLDRTHPEISEISLRYSTRNYDSKKEDRQFFLSELAPVTKDISGGVTSRFHRCGYMHFNEGGTHYCDKTLDEKMVLLSTPQTGLGPDAKQVPDAWLPPAGSQMRQIIDFIRASAHTGAARTVTAAVVNEHYTPGSPGPRTVSYLESHEIAGPRHPDRSGTIRDLPMFQVHFVQAAGNKPEIISVDVSFGKLNETHKKYLSFGTPNNRHNIPCDTTGTCRSIKFNDAPLLPARSADFIRKNAALVDLFMAAHDRYVHEPAPLQEMIDHLFPKQILPSSQTTVFPSFGTSYNNFQKPK